MSFYKAPALINYNEIILLNNAGKIKSNRTLASFGTYSIFCQSLIKRGCKLWVRLYTTSDQSVGN
jgi:hypothetical protein